MLVDVSPTLLTLYADADTGFLMISMGLVQALTVLFQALQNDAGLLH